MDFRNRNYWALILGGSSGFGLATAKKLSSCGMNICVVHRDRRGAMGRIEEEFQKIRANQVKFHSFNLDALSAEGRGSVLSELGGLMQGGKVRMLLHSIALGSVKVMAPVREEGAAPAEGLAKRLQMPPSELQSAIDQEFETDSPALSALATKPAYDSELLLGDEEMAETIFAMGTSLLTWTRDLFKRGLFAEDARVVGLTSEGNEVAWHGYAAVSAAKAALEAVSRSIAREFAPYGIRSNIVQPGVTDTPALRLIPGNKHLAAKAKLRNPFGRLTRVEDVADVIALLSSEEAAWINGSIIRADGGERISG